MAKLIALLGLLAAAVGLPAQTLVNGSFEIGASGWVLSAGTEIKGPVSGDPRIGVDGNQVAQLGLSGVANAYIHQTLTLQPQTTYQLTFYLGSSAAQTGHEAKVRVRATNTVNGTFASNDFTVLTLAGTLTNGYVQKVFNFTTPSSASSNMAVTLFFSDVSTNHTILDPRLDFMVITQTSFPLLTNGGFENGLAGWPVNPGVTVYGPPDFPQIGTEGSFAAALGAGDAANSRLEYHMTPDAGGSYLLTFDVAAMGAAGFRAITLLEIITQPGGTIFSQLYTNTANGATPFGRPPFQAKTVNFTVPGGAASMIIRFSDMSLSGGFGVDPILDNVQLSLLSAPPGLNFYAGISVKGIVGRPYAVDYSDDVGTGTTNWVRMTNLTLTISPTLIFDVTSTNRLKRFYRTVAQ